MFPYEFLTSHTVLDVNSLPSIECFNSKLGVGKQISRDDYIHAQNVWKEFDCESLREYMDIYCQLDVLLLCELFSCFKDNCKQVS